jgi:hypothetical protein
MQTWSGTGTGKSLTGGLSVFNYPTYQALGSRGLLAHGNFLLKFCNGFFQPDEDSGLELVGISFGL